MSGTQDAPARKSEPVDSLDLHSRSEGVLSTKIKFNMAEAECRAEQRVCSVLEYYNTSTTCCPDNIHFVASDLCNNTKLYHMIPFAVEEDMKGIQELPYTCYGCLNLTAKSFENSEMQDAVYKKCLYRTKLECTCYSPTDLTPSRVVSNKAKIVCQTSDSTSKSNVIPDPAQVHDGTAYGENKPKLIPLMVFSSQDAGAGVHGNRWNCNCNLQQVFQPFNQSGYGCSGPVDTDKSLRDGLLIFFFLVLTVVILAVGVRKGDAIQRKLCRKSRGQHRAISTEEV